MTTPHADMFGAILEVTGWRVPAVPAGRVGKLATALLASGATPSDIRERFGTVDPGNGWWWRRDTWQGQKGNDPNERDLRENCGRWTRAIAVAVTVKQQAPAGWAALDEVRRMRAEAQHGIAGTD
jgi:hypothetical protein